VHEPAKVDLTIPPGSDAHDRDTPSDGERVHVDLEVRGADKLHDHVEGAKPGTSAGSTALAPRASNRT
jgi:hypothetical protein